MKTNIFFIKTAKTATESIKDCLIEYAHSQNLILNNQAYDDFFSINKFNINTNHVFCNEKSLNHFLNSIDPSYPVLKISSVRNPLERLYSHYCFGHPYFKGGMDFNEWYIKTMRGELEDKWNVPQLGDRTNNYMVNYMGINHLDELEEKYDFIFIKEHFTESLEKFGKLLNYKFKSEPKKNINPKSKKNYQFDQEVIDLFKENNQKDIELYNKVVEIFGKK